MRVYLIRHAAAFERDRKRWPDDRQRPLTLEGMKKFRRAAAGLERLAGEIGCVLTSPLTRARQTAEILEAVAGWPRALEAPELAPGRAVEQALAVIGDYAAADPALERLALVGHEPHLTELLARCVAGPRGRVRCELKKGGAACLLFPAVRGGQAPSERRSEAQLDRWRAARPGPRSRAPPDLLGRAQLEWLITPKALRALAGR